MMQAKIYKWIVFLVRKCTGLEKGWYVGIETRVLENPGHGETRLFCQTPKTRFMTLWNPGFGFVFFAHFQGKV